MVSLTKGDCDLSSKVKISQELLERSEERDIEAAISQELGQGFYMYYCTIPTTTLHDFCYQKEA